MTVCIGDKYEHNVGLSSPRLIVMVVESLVTDAVTGKQVAIIHKDGCGGCYRRRVFVEDFNDTIKFKKL